MITQTGFNIILNAIDQATQNVFLNQAFDASNKNISGPVSQTVISNNAVSKIIKITPDGLDYTSYTNGSDIPGNPANHFTLSNIKLANSSIGTSTNATVPSDSVTFANLGQTIINDDGKMTILTVNFTVTEE